MIIFEFLAIPFPVSYVDQPEFYKEISSDRENYAVLEIPSALLHYGATVKFAYYQTIHGKPLVGNHLARTPSNARDFELSTPLIKEFTLLSNDSRDILDQDPFKAGLSILNYYNIRYIIIHLDYLSHDQITYINDILNNILHLNPIHYAEDSLIVYEIPNAEIDPFLALSGGWHGLEDWDGTPTRWMENDATLMIYSDENRTADLNFNALSFHRPRSIEIYVNDLLQMQTMVLDPKDGFKKVIVPGISLKEGANIVRFHVPEGCERPSDMKELNNSDSRCLSVAVQDIKMIEDVLDL